jgi:DDE superfamily endonuclease
MTHWSTRSLARVAVRRGMVPRIAHSTVSLILRSASLQPHRTRYWKTPTLDAEFRARAARILWLYERVDWLHERDEVVLALDEKPNLQVLGRRAPTRLMRPGEIERQEFEYIRHGTVNFLAALVVHSGRMSGWCLAANDSYHLCDVLPGLFSQYRTARRIHLIWDGGPSHVSAKTRQFLRSYPRVRVVLRPAHASWLNQAELLLRSFTAHYLDRGEWTSREQMIGHLHESWPEYNRLFAHPFTWSWTRGDMHQWVAQHFQ